METGQVLGQLGEVWLGQLGCRVDVRQVGQSVRVEDVGQAGPRQPVAQPLKLDIGQGIQHLKN